MRLLEGGVAYIASVIEEDLLDRDTKLHKPHVASLSDLCASALTTRSANTSEWRAVLPRNHCDAKSKERYISRVLSNKLIKPISVMHGFIPELIEMSGSNNKTVILMMDQSKISDGFECLMVSLRVGERAIPVAWKVVATKGAIGFEIQNELLNEVALMIPEGIKILLAADRFYGTSSLINWCKMEDWQYRVRLKGNLVFEHEGGEITGNDAALMNIASLEHAVFNGTKVATNIGILHEKGHRESWIIAMDCKPSKYKTLDYGMRWGIEPMFSDFKSRGFCITKTQLKHEDRIEKLILILAIALYWAVSTGMKPEENTGSIKAQVQIKYRSLLSLFKRGIRFVLNAAFTFTKIPKLWEFKFYVGW